MGLRERHASDTILTTMVFAGLFIVSLVAFPVLGMEGQTLLSNRVSFALFFWPQLLLFPSGVETEHYYIGHGVLIYVATAFWCVVAYGFARLTNRFAFVVRVLLVYPAIVAVAVVVHGGLWVFGMSGILDGP